jgi:thiosulfate/3-mercaptopyruvate sulfurtransferase
MDLVILDARTPQAYAAGHVRGALHADLETQLSSASENGDAARGGRHPLPPLDRWLRQVEAWGIGPSTRVLVYDDQGGANAAARVWWMLRAIGHADVQVVPQEDVERCASEPVTRVRDARTSNVTEWQLPTANLRQVEMLRRDPTWRVLDVRSTPRFRGETEPIDPVAGHIPGAINLPFTENLENGHFKSAAALRRMYHDLLGTVPPERVIVHCGSGVTACHTLLALHKAGLQGASLYVGSWGEWCRNELLPIAVG